MKPGTLRLDRFCGHELYPVERTSTYVGRLIGTGERVLNLELWCGTATEHTVPEDEFLAIDPSAEIWVPVADASWPALVGTKAHVEWSYHEGFDAFNRLYCAAHEKVWGIDVEFLEAEGNHGHVRWRAKTRDPNHYGGDKPDTIVSVDAWFELKE